MRPTRGVSGVRAWVSRIGSPSRSDASVYVSRSSTREGETHDARKDLFESVGCTGRFGFTAVEAVFEFKEGLTDGVGEGDAGRVNERDRADAPTLK